MVVVNTGTTVTPQHQLSYAADCPGGVFWRLLHNPPEGSGV